MRAPRVKKGVTSNETVLNSTEIWPIAQIAKAFMNSGSLHGDELYEDCFGETTGLRSRARTSCATEFKTASCEDLETLLSNTENRNTKKTTQIWINRFNTWRESRKIALKLHEMPPDELEKILQHFYAELIY